MIPQLPLRNNLFHLAKWFLINDSVGFKCEICGLTSQFNTSQNFVKLDDKVIRSHLLSFWI